MFQVGMFWLAEGLVQVLEIFMFVVHIMIRGNEEIPLEVLFIYFISHFFIICCLVFINIKMFGFVMLTLLTELVW